MTFFERVWAEAAETFSKQRGHSASLTPWSRTWKQVLGRAEHALWTWNGKYGPLTASQREYAAELVCHALIQARHAEDSGGHYAYFNISLTGLLNHERVDEGFKARADRTDALGDVIGGFAQVAA